MARGAALGLLAAVVQASAPAPLTRAEADRLERKLDAVTARAALTAEPGRPLRTVFLEREVNAYFRFQGAAQLPAGLVNPTITMPDAGKVIAVATVDLDAIRTARTRTWADPLAYVTGMVEVHASGWLRGANGTGTFVFESATLAGVPIPKPLLQEIVSYFSKSADRPSGITFDQPFDLPQKIRQIDLQRGAAVIVQ